MCAIHFHTDKKHFDLIKQTTRGSSRPSIDFVSLSVAEKPKNFFLLLSGSGLVCCCCCCHRRRRLSCCSSSSSAISFRPFFTKKKKGRQSILFHDSALSLSSSTRAAHTTNETYRWIQPKEAGAAAAQPDTTDPFRPSGGKRGDSPGDVLRNTPPTPLPLTSLKNMKFIPADPF